MPFPTVRITQASPPNDLESSVFHDHPYGAVTALYRLINP